MYAFILPCVYVCVFLQVSERVLLHTIAFQLSVKLPYPHVHRLVKSVIDKNDENQAELVTKTAWAFVADRFFLPSCFFAIFLVLLSGPGLGLLLSFSIGLGLGLSRSLSLALSPRYWSFSSLSLVLVLVLISWFLSLLSWS
jgi:hypothetical protein